MSENINDKGYIYCFSNPSMEGYVKVGMTMRTPEERADELFTTGVPFPFKIEFAVKTQEPKKNEKLLHSILSRYGERCPRREFFRISIDEVRTFFDLIIINGGEEWKEVEVEEDTEEVEEVEEVEEEVEEDVEGIEVDSIELFKKDLVKSSIIECKINDKNIQKKKYRPILIELYEQTDRDIILDKTSLYGAISSEEINDKGYKYYEQLDLYIRGVDSRYTLQEIINIIKIKNFKMELKIKLKNGELIKFRMT